MSQLSIPNGAILIAGGYGIVGAQASRRLRDRNPDVKLLIAGRNSEKAAELARELGHAVGVAFDIESGPDPLAGINEPIPAVLAVVNDRDDHLMQSCIRRSIPYIDVTRWTKRVQVAVFKAAVSDLTSPVVFSSSWMAGVPAMLAAHHARHFVQVDTIDMDILYSLSDMAGPNSVEYIDRLAFPFSVLRDGKWVKVYGLSDPKPAEFFSGLKGSTYRFDAPDQVILPHLTHAKTVSTRMTYDDQGTMDLMADLVSSGIWEKLSESKFDDFRRSLIYNPGEGGAHQVTTTITGRDKNGAEMTRTIMIRDPVSQTHLTALGSVIQVEHALGLDGSTPRTSGIYFAENHRNVSLALATLSKYGVEIRVG